MYLQFKLLTIVATGYFLSFCDARHGAFISKNDSDYGIIKIKVSHAVWQQALYPTPVLKSPITVTIPVHVPEEEEDEEENEIEDIPNNVTEVSVIVDTTLINNDITPVPVSPVTSVSNVTQAPVFQDGPPEDPVQEVSGQVTRFPCTCNDGQCGCCTGAILDRFKMKACGNISFVPEDFVFDVRLSVNNNTVVRRRVSASDPPPICFNPRRAPFVRVCAEISNIRIRNGNAFACLDINADIATFPVYSASFRCFGLGSSGIQTGLKPKPVSSGPKPISIFGSSSTNNDGSILDAAGQLLTGGGNGLFGAPGGGLFGGGGGGGPLDVIGDAVGGFLDGRDLE